MLLVGASSAWKRLPSCVAVNRLVMVAVERPGSMPSAALAVPCQKLSSRAIAMQRFYGGKTHPEVIQTAGIRHVAEERLAALAPSAQRAISRARRHLSQCCGQGYLIVSTAREAWQSRAGLSRSKLMSCARCATRCLQWRKIGGKHAGRGGGMSRTLLCCSA